MTLFPGSIYGGLSQLGASAKAAAAPWYLTGGISAANCIAAYQPKGAADLAASYVNLANPGTYNAAPGTAPTWDAVNGWKFNGSNQYLTSGIIPTPAYTMICRFSGVTSALNQSMWGIRSNTANAFYLVHPNRSDGVGWRYGEVSTSVAPGLQSGVLALAGPIGYRNGTADTIAMVWNGTLSHAIFIGAYNNIGTAVFPAPAGNIQAFAIYNITLNATQVGLLTTAMAAL